MTEQKFIFAIPKGRIWEQLAPMLESCGIVPEDDFTNPKSRKLQFATNLPNLDIIRVRAFDVATFVAYGGAHLGVVGSDVIEEFEYDELYAPVELGIGKCRLSVAVPKDKVGEQSNASHVRIATKYPHLTAKHYAKSGVQAECIKLNGAMEIAPALGLAGSIVDLVETGSTLKANNLVETDQILDVSSKLIVNRTALKTHPDTVGEWVENFRKAVA
jgi:ATP phosphoribosyltransferase